MGISLTMVMSCDVIGYSEATIWSSSLGCREHQKRVVPVFFFFGKSKDVSVCLEMGDVHIIVTLREHRLQ